VRTLDAGGDKDLPYAELASESNPYLGVRAIRLSLRRLDLFLPQLRAILRAGAEANLQIMFPMVSNLEEIQHAQALLERAHLSLAMEGLAHRWPIGTGIMVEVPSAALLSQSIAPYVDFFSIGTNDLTQYTLAAERGNSNLAEYADALHPAVLRLIKQVVEAAHQHRKWVGVCGEIAGDPLATPLLVGLGVDELSMTPADIPAVKLTLQNVNLIKASRLANQALNCTDPEAVRSLARAFLS
jgi:phosphoenolpyruvate-protein kinase (PTS system EI component)